MSFRDSLVLIDRCLAVAASTASLDVWTEPQTMCDDRTDWLTVFSLANQHLITPALWTTFDRPGLRQQLPEDVRSYLALLHSRNADRNARIRQQCLAIGSILARVKVRAVLLKGASWLFDGSLEPASDRMMRDIDLLLAPEEFEVAIRALIASGYRETSEGLVEVGHFHHAPLLPPDGVASVEIHRDLAHRVTLLPALEVLASARVVAPGLLLPSARHRIVHNVIHAQIENGDFAGGTVQLRDTLDLARLLMNSSSEIDWMSVAGEARERGFFNYLSGAVEVAHRVLGSAIPPPLASSRGRLHAFRCVHQRRWPLTNTVAGKFGVYLRALAWDRDAYALNLKTRSFRARLLVNKRRAQRAKKALRG